ncbi:ankyrin repeat domain-containing protein [Streptomyces sp. NPDC003717]|uniref:ankyrin repeat domain-containing protein n=1 Tax=Streptomyces sp. NPDC003717 TaxID=3154276 RepID=UPI0033B9A094
MTRAQRSTAGMRLTAAVRRGDAEAVTASLTAGAAPDTVTDDGLPVLCLAIAAYDAAVAEALVEGGADPDRELPDGTTPLTRAVEGGSPAVASAVRGREPRLRLPEAERERLLALARWWYERGAEDGLRDRTGAPGPALRTRMPDDEYHHATQLTLGGVTARDGHGAILTDLEWAFRVLTPVDELVARAVACRDPDHVDWWSARWILGRRRSKETWTALTTHRHAPAPETRRFVVDVLDTYLMWWPSSHRDFYVGETADLLVAWATEGDDDPGVLAEVLRVLSETEHRQSEAVGLRHAGHPDPRVRARVPDLLRGWDPPVPPLSAEARAALLVLARDADWLVRAGAGRVLTAVHDGSAEFTDVVVALLRDPVADARAFVAEGVANDVIRSPAVADALVALLDEADLGTRLNAAYALLRLDDPRTGEAIERVGPLSRPGYEHDHRLSAFWTWQRNRENAP